jgi:S1-C subfamily serine protease
LLSLVLQASSQVKDSTHNALAIHSPLASDLTATAASQDCPRCPRCPAPPPKATADCCCEKQVSVPDLVDAALPSVVLVKVTKKNSYGKPVEIFAAGFVASFKDGAGLIITASHVLDRADAVSVKLHDGTELHAWVHADSPSRDLCLLRVKTTQHLKPLKLSGRDSLRRGESVVVIGHPYNHEDSVAVGVIAGLKREIPLPRDVSLKGVYQLSLPVNPGNSGGPLLDKEGVVAGVVVAMYERAQCMGYAVPASVVKQFLANFPLPKQE